MEALWDAVDADSPQVLLVICHAYVSRYASDDDWVVNQLDLESADHFIYASIDKSTQR